ncbi:MAG: hypothetical protein L6R36_003039 [Xanthoria steineri]|nr:MAG: hypothetical protein L6R36_003039 [Xanthoria steineri]
MSWQAYVDTRYESTPITDSEHLLIPLEALWPQATSIRLPSSIPKAPASGLRPPASPYAPLLLDGISESDTRSPISVSGQTRSRASTDLRLLQVAPAEIKAVVASFADKDDVKKVQSEGFHIASEKFFTLKSDERSLYGKKGKEGVVVVKTQQAILVAHYPESVQPGSAATTVEQLGDYLISVGY